MQCKYSLWYASSKSWLDTWNSYLSVGLKSHNLQAFRGESVLEKKQYIQIIEGSYNFSSGTSWQCAVSRKKNKVGVSRYSLSKDEPWHTVQQDLTLHYVGRSHCLVPLLLSPFICRPCFWKLSVRQVVNCQWVLVDLTKHAHISLQWQSVNSLIMDSLIILLMDKTHILLVITILLYQHFPYMPFLKHYENTTVMLNEKVMKGFMFEGWLASIWKTVISYYEVRF